MKFDSNTRLLVVAAHPDDEVLGCGGTLLKARAAGATVKVFFCGEGVAARYQPEEFHNEDFEKATAVRMAGAKKALEILEIDDVDYNPRYCSLFDQDPLIKITKEIGGAIAAFKPTMLFTHDNAEVNTDHKIVYRAVEAACRPTGSHVVPEIYTFEIACSGRWVFDEQFQPNVFVNIEEFYEKKLEAWHCYEGEARPFPFPRSDEGLETIAKYRGIMSGQTKVEAFRLIRKIC